MPFQPPVHRHAGYRTPALRKAEADKRRATDPGRQQRKALYNSREWAQLREAVRLANPWCVDCQAEGRMRPWTDLDHVVDLAAGGDPLSMDNLAGRCATHHARKTATTRGFAQPGHT
jgi:5-methylcytosine-specific restriction enzyme A